jgi:hypothetical protein
MKLDYETRHPNTQELDYETILPACGGRLSQNDAFALHETAMDIQANRWSSV